MNYCVKEIPEGPKKGLPPPPLLAKLRDKRSKYELLFLKTVLELLEKTK